MTLAGAFFSNRARTSAHIAFVTLTGVLGDFIKDLERAGPYGEALFSNALRVRLPVALVD
jgi:hypothetical protein